MIKELFEEYHEKLLHEFDNKIIEGLKRKGYTFRTRNELEEFVKENCKIVRQEHEDLKESQTFYVNKVPFLYYVPATGLQKIDQNENRFSVTLGSYSFL